MLRSRINNLIIALGLVFLYSAVSSITAEMQQSIPDSEQIAAQQKVDASTKAVPLPTRTPFQSLAQSPAQSGPAETQDVHADDPLAGNSSGIEIAAEQLLMEEPALADRAAGVEASDMAVREDQVEPPALPERPAVPEVPVRLSIPAIELDAPVVIAETRAVKVSGKKYLQWLVPDKFAAGWHEASARLGEIGNTVLNGHHNLHGEVFRRLVDLNVGDTILVYSEESLFTYVITNKMILPEKYEQLDVRMENARWILPSDDERLTLITCWPYESNTHRLVIAASPVSYEKLAP